MANPNYRCCAASDNRSVVNDATDSSHAAEVIPLQDEEKLAVSSTKILAIIKQAEEERKTISYWSSGHLTMRSTVRVYHFEGGLEPTCGYIVAWPNQQL